MGRVNVAPPDDWHDVNDILPNEGQRVMTDTDNGNFQFAHYRHGIFLEEGSNMPIDNVTHWIER